MIPPLTGAAFGVRRLISRDRRTAKSGSIDSSLQIDRNGIGVKARNFVSDGIVRTIDKLAANCLACRGAGQILNPACHLQDSQVGGE
jgi:hypothetical protein